MVYFSYSHNTYYYFLLMVTVWPLSYFSYLFPLINLEGPQLEFFTRLISWMKFETKEDYDKYFSRLNAFPTQVCNTMVL